MGADNGASQPSEVFDLGALERDTKPPFQFRMPDGREFTMPFPEDLDWQDQLSLEEATINQSIRIICPNLVDVRMPGWMAIELFKAWAKHCGIDIPESLASSGSSTVTARPSKRTSGTTTGSGSRTSRRVS